MGDETLQNQLDAMPEPVTTDIPEADANPDAGGDTAGYAGNTGESAPPNFEAHGNEGDGEPGGVTTSDLDGFTPEEPGKDDDRPADRGQKKDPVRRKIDRLTRARREAEEMAENLARENTQLREQLQTNNIDLTEPPDEEYFETFEEYNDALAVWKANKLIADNMTREQEEAARKAQFAAAHELEAQMDAGRQRYQDFDAVALRQPHEGGPVITRPMMVAMQESDSLADIAYHLGKYPQQAAQIAALPPIGQVKAIATLEAQLTGGNTSYHPASKRISNAPAPISPVGSGGRTTKNPDAMSLKEFEETYRSGGFSR